MFWAWNSKDEFMNAYGWLAKMYASSSKPLFQIRPKLHAACIYYWNLIYVTVFWRAPEREFENPQASTQAHPRPSYNKSFKALTIKCVANHDPGAKGILELIHFSSVEKYNYRHDHTFASEDFNGRLIGSLALLMYLLLRTITSTTAG